MKKTFIALLAALIIAALVLFASHKQIQAPITEPVVIDTTPTPVVYTDWKTVDSETVSYQYPETIGAQYIGEQEWPPAVIVTAGEFTCNETNGAGDSFNQVQKQTISGRDYCVTAISEGAAGSFYTTYTYTTVRAAQLVNLTFTLRAVQCMNYDDPEQSACLDERSTFDAGVLADEIIQTVAVK